MFIGSLEKRLAVFVLVPTALFLAVTGFLGFLSIRNLLLKEWQETAILRLERAAHHLDMRLSRPLGWLQALPQAGAGPQGRDIRAWIFRQLQEHGGATRLTVSWGPAAEPTPSNLTFREEAWNRVAAISPPRFSYPAGADAVALETNLLNDRGEAVGRVEVLVTFKYLMQDVLTTGWMETHMACLVDQTGRYLAHSDPAMAGRHCLGEGQDPLELAMLKALQERSSGTILGPGHPPEHVLGFYRLKEAPWAIMLHAQGRQILAPIIQFRFYYAMAGLAIVILLLLLIRLGVGPMVSSIREISRAAGRVAQGEYGEPLAVRTQDEIGQLTLSFNDMVAGLKERDFISNTFGRYVDQAIARELLRRPESARLGGEKRPVAILFADIRGFTPLAETLTPEATIHLINRHFSRMIQVIQEHGGIIVDFLGDAILAFFDPLDGPLKPAVRRAVACALKMQAAVAEMNAAVGKYPPLAMGVGVHAGEVVVGNIGSETRAKYGIVGAAVNLTHRLQAQAQGGEVVVSDAVRELVAGELVVQRTFQAELKGIQEPASLYIVKGLSEL